MKTQVRYFDKCGKGCKEESLLAIFIYLIITIIILIIIIIIQINSNYNYIINNKLCLKYQNKPDITKFKTKNKFSYKYKKNNKKRTLSCNYNDMNKYKSGYIYIKYIITLILIFFLIGIIIGAVFTFLEYKKEKEKEVGKNDKDYKIHKVIRIILMFCIPLLLAIMALIIFFRNPYYLTLFVI